MGINILASQAINDSACVAGTSNLDFMAALVSDKETAAALEEVLKKAKADKSARSTGNGEARQRCANCGMFGHVEANCRRSPKGKAKEGKAK